MDYILQWLANMSVTTLANLFNFQFLPNISIGSTLVYFGIVFIAINFFRGLLYATR